MLGHDIVRQADAVRSKVSLTGQYPSVDADLTGRENLVLLARLLGYRRVQAKARAGELLDAFDLTQAAGRLVNTYSGGNFALGQPSLDEVFLALTGRPASTDPPAGPTSTQEDAA